MKNYQETWKNLDRRERAINFELRQPGISEEWRRTLEGEKRKVQIGKQKLMREFKSDGDRDYEAAKPVNASKSDDNKPSGPEQDQAQARQVRQGRDHLRDLEIKKWSERQRS